MLSPDDSAGKLEMTPSGNGLMSSHSQSDDDYDNADEMDAFTPELNPWWYATVNLITAMVGSGVLGMPGAMATLQWFPGVCLLVLLWFLTFYTLYQLVDLHDHSNKAFIRYHMLANEALGVWGVRFTLFMQIVVFVGTGVVYILSASNSLERILACTANRHVNEIVYICMFCSLQIVLSSRIESFHTSKIFLLLCVLACCCSIGYCTIVYGLAISYGRQPNVSYDRPGGSTKEHVFGICEAISTFTFAYAGHAVVLENLSSIGTGPRAKRPMLKGCAVGYLIVAYCYFCVAIAGYWSFGNAISGNILNWLETPRWVVVMANSLVVLHMIGSFQIFTVPLFQIFEEYLIQSHKYNQIQDFLHRLVYRTSYILIVGFVAAIFPHFSDLLTLLAGVALAPSTYVMPPLLWMILKRPSVYKPSFWTNVSLLVLGGVLAVVALMGSIYNLTRHLPCYVIFQEAFATSGNSLCHKGGRTASTVCSS
eukprot:TRINITY_DN1845_c0_g1_i1.p1 TRINITY_DN1845_c0_g1~~TRINITY_DN1845_c0_g1_i1.p1  ORF type:complete len:480 (-),score=28.50 TRINITY_DN1845_c0_g1_i1:406-1845(-)